jgi:hypothetical protein
MTKVGLACGAGPRPLACEVARRSGDKKSDPPRYVAVGSNLWQPKPRRL